MKRLFTPQSDPSCRPNETLESKEAIKITVHPAAASFHSGARYASYKEFSEALEAYQVKNNVLFTKSRSDKLYPGHPHSCCIYKRLVYGCKQGVLKRRSESKGIRNVITRKVGCHAGFSVYFRKGFLEVTQLNEEHEKHDVNKEVFDRYSERRRLTEEQKREVSAALRSGGKVKEVQSRLLMKFNKNVLLQDLKNFRHSLKIKQQKVAMVTSRLNDIISDMPDEMYIQYLEALTRILTLAEQRKPITIRSDEDCDITENEHSYAATCERIL